MVVYFILLDVQEIENCGQNIFPNFLYLFYFVQNKTCKFLGYLHDAFLEEPQRVIEHLVSNASCFRVDTHASQRDPRVEVVGEETAEHHDLLIRKDKHLQRFDRVGHVADVLLAEIQRDGEEDRE